MERLGVQTILFGHSAAVIDRWLRGVLATVLHVHAGRRTVEPPVNVTLGDCSPAPVVSPSQRARWTDEFRRHGIVFEVVDFGVNLGHGRGQNALAERAAAGTDFLLMLNPDGTPSVTMLSELMRAVEPDVAAVEARQSPLEHPKAYDPATGSTSWVSGAAMLVRTDAFGAVGGFDADTFFLHGDDVDISWRLRLAGWRLKHVPEAVFFHDKRLGASGAVIAPESEQRFATLGALLLLHKYSRPDAVNHWEHHLDAWGNDAQRGALREFQQRRADGQLPEPIDAGHEVSEVVGANWGHYRF